MFSVKNYFQNLNLFERSDDIADRENEREHRSNIISTRVYLIVLAMALILIGIAFWLYPKTTIVTIESNFHQVCSRDFVTDRWFKAIFSGSNSTYSSITECRTYGIVLNFKHWQVFIIFQKRLLFKVLRYSISLHFLVREYKLKLFFNCKLKDLLHSFNEQHPINL